MKREYVLGIVFMMIGVMLVFNINYMSYSVYELVEPDLILDMVDSYLENTTLDGDIIIKFNGPIRANSLLEIEIDGEDYSRNVEDILVEKSISYDETQDTKKGISPTTNKLLVFEEAGRKELGLRLPKDVNLDSLSLKITGASYNDIYPKSVSLSIGDFIWKYLGDFNTWNSTFYYPEGLETESYSQDTIMSNDYFYCELLNLPFSKDYRIYTQYKANSGGNLEASLYYNFNLNEKLGKCSLPSPSTVYQWNYCDIRLDDSAVGDILVCVNATGEYRLATAQTPSDSTFRCDSNMNCENVYYAIYLMKVQGGDYVFNSSSPIMVNEDESGLLLNAIENALGSCNYGDDYYCFLPFKIEVESAGRIVLEDLRLVYRDIVYNLFYDVLSEESIIYGIRGKSIEGNNVSYALSNFNISLNKGEYDFVVMCDGVEESKRISVGESISEFSDIQNMVSSTSNLIDSLEGNEILQLLNYNIEGKRASFNALVSRFNNLKMSNESYIVKRNAALQIKNEINNLRESLDISISETKNIKDKFIAEPGDISGLNLEEEIYEQQSKYDISFEAKLIEIKEPNRTNQYSLFKKRVLGSGVYSVYEIIPKSIASDVSLVSFKMQPEIIENDPIAKWNNINEIVYYVEGDKVNNVYDTKTIIEPREKADGKSYMDESICGDNICGTLEDEESCPEDCERFRIPWVWVFLIIIIFLIGIGYIFFYKGRGDIRSLGKKPFKSKRSLEGLIQFIENSKLSKDEVTKLLLARRWSAEQIKYAFDEVEWKRKKVLIETPKIKDDIKPLVQFIKKGLDSNIPLPKIKNALLLKGWKEEQINEALKEISK